MGNDRSQVVHEIVPTRTEDLVNKLNELIDCNQNSTPDALINELMKMCKTESYKIKNSNKTRNKLVETIKSKIKMKEIELKEIVELFEKKLDKQNIFKADFDIKDEKFKNYLIELFREYHEITFETENFEIKCGKILEEILKSINQGSN